MAAGATPAERDTLGRELGVDLPEELQTLLAWHNGQRADVPGSFEGHWNLVGSREIAELKRRLDAAAPPGWKRHWIPLFDDDSGNYLALDAVAPGHPLHACWLPSGKSAVLAPSLTAWLADFLAALERGDYYEDPERGAFHRRRENG